MVNKLLVGVNLGLKISVLWKKKKHTIEKINLTKCSLLNISIKINFKKNDGYSMLL